MTALVIVGLVVIVAGTAAGLSLLFLRALRVMAELDEAIIRTREDDDR